MKKTMQFLLAIFLAFVIGSAYAVAVDEGLTRINTIDQTGKDVGQCVSGSALAYAPDPYKGISYFALAADQKLAAAHAKLTAKEQKWLQDLSGPSSQNRLYVDKSGNRALVLSICKQGNCGAQSAYAAFDLSSHEYGIELSENNKIRSIGTIGATSRAAIACASQIDYRLRTETEEKYFNSKRNKP